MHANCFFLIEVLHSVFPIPFPPDQYTSIPVLLCFCCHCIVSFLLGISNISILLLSFHCIEKLCISFKAMTYYWIRLVRVLVSAHLPSITLFFIPCFSPLTFLYSVLNLYLLSSSTILKNCDYRSYLYLFSSFFSISNSYLLTLILLPHYIPTLQHVSTCKKNLNIFLWVSLISVLFWKYLHRRQEFLVFLLCGGTIDKRNLLCWILILYIHFAKKLHKSSY